MSNYVFADSVANVSVLNGIVRFDLMISVIDSDEIKISPAGTLALPLNGFLSLHAQADQIIQKMVADGILKPAESTKGVVAKS